MDKNKVPYKEQEEKSLKENVELLKRVNDLKNRALKLMEKEGEDK